MHNAKEAISTYLPQWIYRPHGNMNHRLTQLMTGHGCFRRFLYRIRKADSRTCLQCLILGNAIFEDTAEHTLFECIAWNDERRDMMAVLKCRSTWPDVINEVCKSQENWKALCPEGHSEERRL